MSSLRSSMADGLAAATGAIASCVVFYPVDLIRFTHDTHSHSQLLPDRGENLVPQDSYAGEFDRYTGANSVCCGRRV